MLCCNFFCVIREKRYKYIRKIGAGKNGVVKLASDLKEGRMVAIKRVNKSRFRESELEILRLISKNPHVNIGNYLSNHVDKISYHLVLEYVEGMELFEMLTKLNKFNENQAKLISYQIFKGINHLHSINICHRDIKPENIIINNNLEIKIIDFGLSTQIQDGKYMREFVGSSYYLSPEVINKKYNHKCDIWSGGIILYILLVGYPPYYGDTDNEIIEKIKKLSYGVPKSLSKDSIRMLDKILVMEKKRVEAKELVKDPYYLGDKTDS